MKITIDIAQKDIYAVSDHIFDRIFEKVLEKASKDGNVIKALADMGKKDDEPT